MRKYRIYKRTDTEHGEFYYIKYLWGIWIFKYWVTHCYDDVDDPVRYVSHSKANFAIYKMKSNSEKNKIVEEKLIEEL